MITFKPIVIPGGRRKDGTWPVKIRVTFQGKSRRLPTTLVCMDSDLTRSGKIKNAMILEQAGELIKRMRATCTQLSPFIVSSWNVDDVVKRITKDLAQEKWQLDFFSFADEIASAKKTSTREGYTAALNAFADFLGKREIDVNQITRVLLISFVDYVNKRPAMHRCRDGKLVESKLQKIPNGVSHAYLAKLSHIYNQAKFRYNDEDSGLIYMPRNPFAGLTKSTYPCQGQPNLGVEVMQRILDWRPQSWMEDVAQAAFVVSFGTMGANLVDMRKQREAPVDGLWIYRRQKTGEEARVLIPSQIAPYIERLRGDAEQSEWWLPALHRWGPDNTATIRINRALKDWAEINKIRPFTFYAARHTWASLARQLGVEKATVDEGLAHAGDYRMADIYAERNWQLAWDANSKVLDLFRWP